MGEKCSLGSKVSILIVYQLRRIIVKIKLVEILNSFANYTSLKKNLNSSE